MAYLMLSEPMQATTKIMIFAEGTVLKPKSALAHFNHKAYVPIGGCVSLIQKWAAQGAAIVYCTSLRKKQVQSMAELLQSYGFCGTRLYFRDQGETYSRLVEQIRPDILIEDDCRSIGGAWQMCITGVAPQDKQHIHSVVVREFKGIDHLPEEVLALQKE